MSSEARTGASPASAGPRACMSAPPRPGVRRTRPPSRRKPGSSTPTAASLASSPAASSAASTRTARTTVPAEPARCSRSLPRRAGPGRSAAASSTRRSGARSSTRATAIRSPGNARPARAGQRPGARFAAPATATRTAAGAGFTSTWGGHGQPTAGGRNRQRRDRQGPSGRSRRGRLDGHSDYAVDCCGDVRIGGTRGRARRILVEDPSAGAPSTSSRSATAASRRAGSAAAPGSETTAGRRTTCSIPRPAGPPSPG